MLQESIQQYCRPSFSYHLSFRSLFCLFLSGRLRQVLLYSLLNFRQTGKDGTIKVKALNETILRLTKSNEQLQSENRGLKEDLRNALEDSKDRVPNSKHSVLQIYFFPILKHFRKSLDLLNE